MPDGELQGKGERGEREAAKEWQRLFGSEMRRSQQYCGDSDESDDIVGQAGLSLEVKRRQSFNLHDAVDKACAEAAEGRSGAVLHRKNHKPWLFTCRLDDLPAIVSVLFMTLAED